MKKYLKQTLLFVAALATWLQSVHSQSFVKADISPNIYTGKNKLTIPVYELSGKDLKIPVELLYESSGVKVNEFSSWVGEGWSLLAGGQISRKINGMSDFNAKGAVSIPVFGDVEDTHGYASINHKANSSNVSLDGSAFQSLLVSKAWDSEFDIYSFQFNNMEGKFTFNSDTEKLFNKEENLGVVFENDLPLQVLKRPCMNGRYNESCYDGESWVLQDQQGFQYVFGGDNGLGQDWVTWETSYNEVTGVTATQAKVWHIREIISPRGEMITFKYDRVNVKYPRSSQELNLATNDSKEESFESQQSKLYLKEITLHLESGADRGIEFTAELDRNDIKGEKRLKEIAVFRKHSSKKEYIKKFVLDQDNLENRLWLTGVKEIGLYNGVDDRKPPFTFEYYNHKKLPANTSSVDYWGYYNGTKANSDNKLPKVAYALNGDVLYNKGGVDKSSNVDFAKYGLLTKVKYPTGGYTNFEYELNTFNNLSAYKEKSQAKIDSRRNKKEINVEESTAVAIVADLLVKKKSEEGLYEYDGSQQWEEIVEVSSNYLILESSANADKNSTLLIKGIEGDARGYAQEVALRGDITNKVVKLPSSGKYILQAFERKNINSLKVYEGEIDGEMILTKNDGGSVQQVAKFMEPQQRVLELEKGNYTLELTASDNASVAYVVMLDRKKEGAGLRLKRIADNNGKKEVNVKNFIYSEESNGLLFDFPVNISESKSGVKIIEASKNNSISFPKSVSIGYSTVVVNYGDKSEFGKTKYNYSNEETGLVGNIKNASTDNWKRGFLEGENLKISENSFSGLISSATSELAQVNNGLLISKEDFKNANGEFIKIKEESYTYQESDKSITGTKFKNIEYSDLVNAGEKSYVQPRRTLAYQNYEIPFGKSKVKQVTTSYYDDNSDVSYKLSEKYSYNKLNKLSSVEKIDSRNNKEITSLTSSAHSIFDNYSSMAKSSSSIKINDQKEINNGELVTKYGTYNRLDKYMRLPSAKYAQVNSSTEEGKKELKIIEKYKYDRWGNVSEKQLEDGKVISYLWDVDENKPCAVVENAKAEDIAYASFEKGNYAKGWEFVSILKGDYSDEKSITGDNSLNLGSLAKRIMNEGNYTVSCWATAEPTIYISGLKDHREALISKNKGETIKGMTYYEYEYKLKKWQKISIGVDEKVANKVLLDELRLYPSTASMTTFVYDPLVGVKEKNDENNVVTHYNYDVMGRLEEVKDHNGNIVERYEYDYKSDQVGLEK